MSLVVGGPKVVALGGGHGLAATLRAVRKYAGEITAIVSAADDGGSSGRLREAMDAVPPGDLRKCLVALADPALLLSSSLDYRFDAGELEGHALGNLLIAGLAEVSGNVLLALAEVERLVGSVGAVLPATLDAVVLKAVARDAEVGGQVAVASTRHIGRIFLEPDDPEPPEGAVEAIRGADQVIIGPGSLYTSVLAAVVAPRLRAAIGATGARRVYVCNLRAQAPEAAGYGVADHVAALEAHGVDIDVVLCDSSGMSLGALSKEYVDLHLAKENGLAHDPEKLAVALRDLVS